LREELRNLPSLRRRAADKMVSSRVAH
jgi:hypothetical protein